MGRYQVRIPEALDFDAMLGRMAGHCIEILKAWDLFDPSKISAASYGELDRCIRETIVPYVKTYKLCGVSNICSDHLQTTNWVNDDQVNPSPTDMIHQLFIPGGLEEFIQKMAEASLNHLTPSLRANTREQTLSILCSVFRCVLGEYVFYNPICGKTELCTCSVLAPRSPWWRRR